MIPCCEQFQVFGIQLINLADKFVGKKQLFFFILLIFSPVYELSWSHFNSLLAVHTDISYVSLMYLSLDLEMPPLIFGCFLSSG